MGIRGYYASHNLLSTLVPLLHRRFDGSAGRSLQIRQVLLGQVPLWRITRDVASCESLPALPQLLVSDSDEVRWRARYRGERGRY